MIPESPEAGQAKAWWWWFRLVWLDEDKMGQVSKVGIRHTINKRNDNVFDRESTEQGNLVLVKLEDVRFRVTYTLVWRSRWPLHVWPKEEMKYSRAWYGSTKLGVTPGGWGNPPIGLNTIELDHPWILQKSWITFCIRVWKKLGTTSFPICFWNSGIVSLNKPIRSSQVLVHCMKNSFRTMMALDHDRRRFSRGMKRGLESWGEQTDWENTKTKLRERTTTYGRYYKVKFHGWMHLLLKNQLLRATCLCNQPSYRFV